MCSRHPRPAVTRLSGVKLWLNFETRKTHLKTVYFRNILLTLQNPSMHICFISHLLGADKQLLHTDSAIKPVNSYYISITASWNVICLVWRKLLQIIFDVSFNKWSYPKHLASAMLRPIQTSDYFFQHKAFGLGLNSPEVLVCIETLKSSSNTKSVAKWAL